MIFKKLPSGRFLFVICLVFLQVGISCNRNPVGEDFDDKKENYNNGYKVLDQFALAQDTYGTLFSVDYEGISIALNDSTLREVYSLLFDFGNRRDCGNVFVKDKMGALVISVDSNLVRIVRSDSGYTFDSIGTFLNYRSLFVKRYTVDDNEDLWFSDERDSILYLLQWDGEKMYTHSTNFKIPTGTIGFGNVQIAAGGGFLYCVYDSVHDSENIDSHEKIVILIKWSINERNGERILVQDQDYLIEKLFVINGILHILISRDWPEEYELFCLDKNFLLKNTGIDFKSRYSLNLLKRNSQEVYLYSDAMLVQVTNTVIVKNLHSECDALFLDTANQVILHDHYSNKLINVSELPGF